MSSSVGRPSKQANNGSIIATWFGIWGGFGEQACTECSSERFVL